MSEEYVELSRDVIEQITALAASIGAEAARKEFERQAGQMTKRRYKWVYKQLDNYRRIKKVVNEELVLTPDEEEEFRFKFMKDLMGDPIRHSTPDRVVNDLEKRHKENMYCLRRLERAADLYKQECMRSDSEEKKRRADIFEMRFMDDHEFTLEEISCIKNVSVDTVRRDIRLSVEIIEVFLCGA